MDTRNELLACVYESSLDSHSVASVALRLGVSPATVRRVAHALNRDSLILIDSTSAGLRLYARSPAPCTCPARLQSLHVHRSHCPMLIRST
jgi:Mn-dependent DtxR family transcriptional regulator